MIENSKERKKFNFLIIYILLFSAIIVIFFIYRLIRGADITDESFYCTMAFRLAKGNYLLKDMWEQSSTSALLPALFLKIYYDIFGGVEGTILFLRIIFMLCNFGTTIIFFITQKNYLDKLYIILIALVYFIYAPFHFYIFSYNNLSDMLILLVINIELLAIEKRKIKVFILAGGICAFLAFTYPTMIILCPIMVWLLFLQREKIKKAWLYFTAGGIFVAVVIFLVFYITIGMDEILIGIKGILSDPAYNIKNIPINKKLENAFENLFTPISDKGFWIKIFCIWLFFVGFFKKKYPVLKISIGLYPIIVYLALMPVRQLGTYGTGNYIFYLSFLCPFMIFFTDKNRELFSKFLYFEWIPSLLFYIIISISSYGGAIQARQGLFLAAIVTLKEIVFIIIETFEEIDCLFIKKIRIKKWKEWFIVVLLSAAVVGELSVYYAIIYREEGINNLTAKVEKGPYKGIYTTEQRKSYLEEMTDLMKELQEKDKTVLVLYHSNFVYLMLDMIPATPTTWGLYPHIDNENVFFQYFSRKTNIPEVIFIVDVPDEFNLDSQSEKYYSYCNQLREFIDNNYILVKKQVVYKTGIVRKYILKADKEILFGYY